MRFSVRRDGTLSFKGRQLHLLLDTDVSYKRGNNQCGAMPVSFEDFLFKQKT